MTNRISLGSGASEPGRQLRQLHALVEKTAADAGLDQRLIELVKIRSSMVNGCAFCLDMHTRGARMLGEAERRIFLLGALCPGSARARRHDDGKGRVRKMPGMII